MARHRRAAPPSAAARAALAHFVSSKNASNVHVTFADGHRRFSASPANPRSPSPSSSFPATRAAARPPELLSLLRVEHGDHVPARGTAPAHLEPRAYAPGVENVRAGRDARVSSSLDRFATHGTAHRGFTSVADQRNPIVVAGDTPRKRRDRGVGRRARRIVARERIVSRERRSRRRVALGVEAAIVRVVARSRPPSPRSVLEPPSALARAAAAPTPAPVAVDGDAGVERLAPCAAAAVQ